MAGRRRTGVAAGAIDLASNLLLHNMQQQQERRRHAEEIYLKLAVERQLNELKRQEALGQIQRGALPGTNLEPRSLTDPVTGVRFAVPPAPKPPEFLTPSQSEALLGGAFPGEPLPKANVPLALGPSGINTMNRATALGLSESPLAESLGEKLYRFNPETGYYSTSIEEPPQGALSAIRQYASLAPRAMLGQLALPRVSPTQRIPRRPDEAPPAAPTVPAPSLDESELVAEATKLSQQPGVTRDILVEELIALGVDAELAESIADQAGL